MGILVDSALAAFHAGHRIQVRRRGYDNRWLMQTGLFIRGYAVLVLSLLILTAQAACQHFTPPDYKPGEPPSYDGMGAFGPLNNTMTLDCLRYVGNIKNGRRSMALLKDDHGRQYTLKVGDYVGEKSGSLIEIHDDYLLIKQTVAQGDEWVSRLVRLKRFQTKPADESHRRRQVLSELLDALQARDGQRILDIYVSEQRDKAGAYLAQPDGFILLQQYYLPLKQYRVQDEKRLGDDSWELVYRSPDTGSRRHKLILRRDPDRYRIVHDEAFGVI